MPCGVGVGGRRAPACRQDRRKTVMMDVRSGVGYADASDSREAGQRAAEKAMANASANKSDFTLAFCGGNHDPFAYLKAVQDVVGETTLIGGTSIGVITAEKAGYGGYEAGVAVVSSDKITFDSVVVGDVDKSEETAGAELGHMLAERSRDDSQAILLFYDSVKSTPPLAVNLATQLIKGVEKGLGGPHAPVLGGGMIKDYQWSGSHVFANDQATTQHAVGVVISGDCSVHHAISHGCEPASDYHTITRIDGPVVRKLDGRPALDVIEDIIGTCTPSLIPSSTRVAISTISHWLTQAPRAVKNDHSTTIISRLRRGPRRAAQGVSRMLARP